jgi:assimilatory nitrate reductase catalytic subunit
MNKAAFEWRGFLVARALPKAIPADYFATIRVGQGWLVELAGNGPAAALAKCLLPRGERAENVDASRGSMRVAVLDGGRLAAALYVTRSGKLPGREWLIERLSAAEASAIELLAGRSAAPVAERGPIVCACFDVGLMTIVEAIGSQHLVSVEAVGRALSAGTNCGSCRPAIERLIGEGKEAALG